MSIAICIILIVGGIFLWVVGDLLVKFGEYLEGEEECGVSSQNGFEVYGTVYITDVRLNKPKKP